MISGKPKLNIMTNQTSFQLLGQCGLLAFRFRDLNALLGNQVNIYKKRSIDTPMNEMQPGFLKNKSFVSQE